MLWTYSQVLPDGAQLRADIFAQDEGCTRSWGEQASQNGPERKTEQVSRFRHYETAAVHARMAELRVGGNPGEIPYQESSLRNISLMDLKKNKTQISSSGDQRTPTWLLEGKIFSSKSFLFFQYPLAFFHW